MTKEARDKRALIVVDVQKDFCEGGALTVAGGADCARDISRFIATEGDEYDVIVATQDWHIDPGDHFGDPADWVSTWPVHCLADSPGAQFHEALSEELDFTSRIDATFKKGQTSAAYSGFEGFGPDDATLSDWLTNAGVTSVDLIGIATRGCVMATATDAVKHGFATRVLVGLCADLPDPPGATAAALGEMAAVGIDVALGPPTTSPAGAPEG